MSWQIPTQIEQDIIAGKATYRTFQTGNGGQSILPVPANSYVIIFGYDFSPAGGGFKARQLVTSGTNIVVNNSLVQAFETQQISFFTGTDFYPFIHHVDVKTTMVVDTWDVTNPETNFAKSYIAVEEIDNTPLARQVYITSSNDVTITHGLIVRALRISNNAIPVTNRTPGGLTYGGSGQSISTQTNYAGALPTPQQFMQPSPKDYQDFGFGLLPSNADGQAFATPDNVEGLVDSSLFAYGSLGASAARQAGNPYFLNLHYALYQKPIPSKQG